MNRIWKLQSLVVFAVLIAAACSIAFAQEANVEEDEVAELVTQVYNVAHLVIAPPPYPFDFTRIPNLDPVNRDGRIGRGGGFGGGGFGGGGFFQVRDSGAGQSGRTTPAIKDLIELITTSITPDTWDEVGGHGTVSEFGNKLIVSQTPQVHAQITELLGALASEGNAARTVTISAVWLELDAAQLESLYTNDDDGTSRALDRKILDKLATSVSGHRGQITCFDGQTVYIVSGRGRTTIHGAIPVVGGGAAYQPIVSIPQAGALLQVTPTTLPSDSNLVLDVQSSVTEWGEREEPIRLGGQPDVEGAQAAGSDRQGYPTVIVDRMNVRAQQLATTLRVPNGRPVLVGGLSADTGDAPQEDRPDRQLYLFVEAHVNDD